MSDKIAKVGTSRPRWQNAEVREMFASEESQTKSGTIEVRNLLEDVTEREIRSLFEEHGSIQRIRIPRKKNRDTKEWDGVGVAYVTFWNEKDATAALDENGRLWNYCRLEVKRSY